MPDKKVTWYIAGPMSGVPKCNIPLFDRVADQMRADGYKVISPAELDDPKIRAAGLRSKTGNPKGLKMSWGDFLARDVKIIADKVNGLVFLPHWTQSRGARLEAFVALLSGYEHFMTVVPFGSKLIFMPMMSYHVRANLQEYMP